MADNIGSFEGWSLEQIERLRSRAARVLGRRPKRVDLPTTLLRSGDSITITLTLTMHNDAEVPVTLTGVEWVPVGVDTDKVKWVARFGGILPVRGRS